MKTALFLFASVLFLFPGVLIGQTAILVPETAGVDRIDQPVTLGIPFRQGQLPQAERLLLRNPQGQEESAQFSVMARWRDGSIRWLKCHFQADVSANSTAVYRLEEGMSVMESTLSVSESSDRIQINTGVLRLAVSKEAFNLFDEVHLDLNGNGSYEASERMVAPGTSMGPEAVQNGTAYFARNQAPEHISVEESGPMRVVLKVAGRHYDDSGEYFLKYETRIYAYAGKPYVRVRHSYANGRSVEQLGNSGSDVFGEMVDRYRLNLQMNVSGLPNFHTAIDGALINEILGAEGSKVVQHDRPTVETPFRATVQNNDIAFGQGNKADGWVALSDDRWGVMVGARYFWEKYPKGFKLYPDGRLSIEPIPEDSDEFLWAAMGTGDEYLFHFFPEGEKNELAGMHQRLIGEPLVAHCDPDHYAATDAFYNLNACYQEEWPNMGNYIETTTSRHLSNRDRLDLYGNIHFGDVPRDEFAVAPDRQYSTWGNNYYDCILTAARLFALSGDRRYYEIMVPMARHFMETQCFQTYDPNDWLNGYSPSYSQYHRSIGHYNQHYGEGIWYYYYLTGDERAREIGLRAARSIRDGQIWGQNNPNARLAYQNASALLEAWKATGDESFLDIVELYIKDRIMLTQNEYGMIGAYFSEGGTAFGGEQTFMMALFSDTVWKYLKEFPEDEQTRDQLLLLADFVHTYARTEPGSETYFNFWDAPSEPGEPEPVLLNAGDDFVFWNGKGLIAGLYAYAYDLSGEKKYRTMGVDLLNNIWFGDYPNAFGQFAWGKASAQAMKNMLHATAILCGEAVTDVEQVGPEQDISIYPNPVAEGLRLEYDGPVDESFTIYNTLGQPMLQGRLSGNRKEKVSVDGLLPGLYFLQIGEEMLPFKKL